MEETLKKWLMHAKSRQLLAMDESEMWAFANRNNFAVYEIRTADNYSLIGWRLYETFEPLIDPPCENMPREVGELYYVIAKK